MFYGDILRILYVVRSKFFICSSNISAQTLTSRNRATSYEKIVGILIIVIIILMKCWFWLINNSFKDDSKSWSSVI